MQEENVVEHQNAWNVNESSCADLWISTTKKETFVGTRKTRPQSDAVKNVRFQKSVFYISCTGLQGGQFWTFFFFNSIVRKRKIVNHTSGCLSSYNIYFFYCDIDTPSLDFYVLWTVNPSMIFVNKPNWRTNVSCMYISILYMFRANICPSSGELTVSMRYLVCVTLRGRWNIPICIPDGRPRRVTCTRYRIDTVNSPDDGHMVARNM